MSLLAVGVSHRSAPLGTLERVAVSSADRPGLLARLLTSPAVTEALLLSTCNRVEVHAVADAPEEAAAHVVDVLARHAGVAPAEVSRSGFVHHGDAAVRHLFEVSSGLDSLVVGDEQVPGQLRAAYAAAIDAGTVGSVLHAVVQQALRVGKQVRTDTGLARAGASVVEAALRAAVTALPGASLAGRRAVVLGAGAMGSLAVAALQRGGAADVVVVNRTPSRAGRLARDAGWAAVRAVPADELAAVLVETDVLVACAASSGALVGTDQVRTAVRARGSDRGPLVICDLGLPRNVEAEVAALPGVVVVDLATLQRRGDGGPAGREVAAARRIVVTQLDAWRARHRAAPAALAVRPAGTPLPS